jgi:hypothetical protein
MYIMHQAVGSSSWYVYQDNDFLGTSTPNFTGPTTDQTTGHETTADGNLGDATSSHLQYLGASFNWHDWDFGDISQHPGPHNSHIAWDNFPTKVSYDQNIGSC